jgi:hypothetical protein
MTQRNSPSTDKHASARLSHTRSFCSAPLGRPGSLAQEPGISAICASSESGSPLLMWCSRPGDRRRCTYRRRHGRPRHLRLRRRPAQDPHRHPGTATCQARRAAAPQPRPLTIHEVKRLLADALSHPNPPGHAAHWLEWRCRHQARTRRHHQRARLARNHVLVS